MSGLMHILDFLTFTPFCFYGPTFHPHGGCQVNGPKVAKFLDREDPGLLTSVSYAFSLAHKLIAKARKGDGG